MTTIAPPELLVGAAAESTPAEAAAATTNPPLEADPHAPKLAPGDPRLRLRRPMARTLRVGPAVALGVGLLGAVSAAVAMALEPSHATPRPGDHAESSAAAPTPTAPDNIRNAPSGPRPTRAAMLASERPDGGGEVPARGAAGAYGPRSAASADEQLALEAAHAGILAPAAGDGALSSPQSSEAERLAAPTTQTAAPSIAAAPSSNGDDPNLQERKNAFAAGALSPQGSDYVPATLHHPRTPNEVLAGAIIPAVLLTAINSDLPGPVIAQVREHIYDTVTGDHLLVPQGSRLIAQYDSMVAWGQERVLVCWNRLLLPNGDSIDLPCMPAADISGAAGLTDEVDEHWGRILKAAAVATLLSATTALAAGNTDSFQPTVPQMMARSSASEIGSIGQQITRRNMNIQPTITVRAGFSCNVMVTRDLDLPPYPMGAAR